MPASDPDGAFKTHSNYIRAFDTAMSTHYAPDEYLWGSPIDKVLSALADGVRSSPAYMSLSDRSAKADTERVAKSLRSAWGTEYLLASTGAIADDELIAHANNWAVVQVYYAIFHAVHALIIALGESSPRKHAALRGKFANLFSSRMPSLVPWSLGWDANGDKNLPPGRTMPTVKSWVACTDESCWHLVGLAIRKTRERSIAGRRKQMREDLRKSAEKAWNEVEQKRLAEGKPPRKKKKFPLPQLKDEQKKSIAKNVRTTTILDYLYRLRIRSNYEDASMFTEGPEDSDQSRDVHERLCRITSGTLLVHEILIEKLIGRDNLCDLLDKWSLPTGLALGNIGVGARRSLLCP